MKKQSGKLFLAILLLAACGVMISYNQNPSKWRYPKLLITQLPKMPFRYFV